MHKVLRYTIQYELLNSPFPKHYSVFGVCERENGSDFLQGYLILNDEEFDYFYDLLKWSGLGLKFNTKKDEEISVWIDGLWDWPKNKTKYCSFHLDRIKNTIKENAETFVCTKDGSTDVLSIHDFINSSILPEFIKKYNFAVIEDVLHLAKRMKIKKLDWANCPVCGTIKTGISQEMKVLTCENCGALYR